MTTRRPPTSDPFLVAWFEDGPTTMPDRVMDVVADRIGRQSQRRSRRLPWRLQMNTQLKLAASLAAILLVAVTGYSLLLKGGIGGPGTTPTVAPTPTAQPAAAATPVPSAGKWPLWYTLSGGFIPGSGNLAADSHTTRRFAPNFTFSVPAGWVNESDEVHFYNLFPDTPANKAEFERSGLLAQSIRMVTYENASITCESGENNRGATAAAMATAITANEALATSGLVDVEIGGLTGKQFDVRLNPDWTGTCSGDRAPPAGHDPEDERFRVILLDALTDAPPSPGVIVLSVRSMTSADFEAFLAEAMPIIQSFDFTP